MLLEKSPLRTGRIAEVADQYVQCGLCLPVCPTYALDRNEAEAPRGRIAIASRTGPRAGRSHRRAALAPGPLPGLPELRSGVPVSRAVRRAAGGSPRPAGAAAATAAMAAGTRQTAGPAACVLRQWGDWLALSRWKGPLARRLPAASPWRAALFNLPSVPPAARVQVPHSSADGPAHLALFPGCVASLDDAEAQHAAITLLQAASFRVSVLPACCATTRCGKPPRWNRNCCCRPISAAVCTWPPASTRRACAGRPDTR